jgi:hypothetical protein
MLLSLMKKHGKSNGTTVYISRETILKERAAKAV